jgi:polysaccharide export outer membrane protein
MASGVCISNRRGRGFVLICAAVLSVCSVLAAQRQDSSPGATSQDSAAPGAVQPASQLARSSTGTASPPSASATKDEGDRPVTVKFGAGDLLEVSVYNVPELATKARVSNSGEIYLPLIDYIHVAGLTQEEAQSVIEKRLEDGGFVRNPHVTIFVDEAESQGVTLLGEVAKPGIYPDTADHKLYEVLSEAGGFTQVASHKIAILRRGKPDPIRVDLPRNLADDLTGNVDVLPGDTITIPRAPVIYVVGDVGRPSGLLIDNGTMTVLQALALAGGTNHTAKMGGVRIIRKAPSGSMTETRVPLKKILEAKAPDITLQSDDILFVPLSGMKVAAGKTADAALAAAAAVSVYTIHP